MPLRFWLALALIVFPLLGLPTSSFAQSVEEKAQLCSACHGETGVPIDRKIPVIWGQQAGYLYLDLRDFKLGNRKNEQMSSIAAALSRDDMLALAEYFSKKPWPNLSQPRAADATVHRAEVAASSGQCTQCHLGGYVGAGTTPRLANQGKQYLLKTMQDFRSGARANNPWMTDLLKTYKDEDIEAMAEYLSGL
jgi:cytochrome c553